MIDEGFLSRAGKRFVIVAALLIAAGLIAYYAATEEISLEFIEELGQTSTTSTTEITTPEVSVPQVDSAAGSNGRAYDTQAYVDCLLDAAGDPEATAKC